MKNKTSDSSNASVSYANTINNLISNSMTTFANESPNEFGLIISIVGLVASICGTVYYAGRIIK